MERIWAPWRMEFILRKEETHDASGEPARCIFCGLLEEEDGPGNLILFRGARAYVVMNRYPYTNGHLMVVPTRHVGDFEFLEPTEGEEMLRLSQRCVRVLREKMNPDGFNIGLNLGRSGGAGIEEHIHIHIVPRWTGDHNFLTVLGDARVIPEHFEQTYRKLRPAFA